MDVSLCSVLHDGEVVAAEGIVPGDLRLAVGIAYLCGHLPTQAEHQVVTLFGCEQFEFRPYERPPVSVPSAVAALGLGLLSAEVADGSIRVECADGRYGGYLLTRFSSCCVAIAEGQSLSQAAPESAAEWYCRCGSKGMPNKALHQTRRACRLSPCPGSPARRAGELHRSANLAR